MSAWRSLRRSPSETGTAGIRHGRPSGYGSSNRPTPTSPPGHPVSARSAYLRATEYLRQAFFFHRDDLDGNELQLAYAASVAAFRKALPLLTTRQQVLTGALSGYLFTPARASGPLPTLLHIDGYDGTAEELYASVYPVLERGYAFAAVDGPGQGAVLYEQRIPMRPDWENVVPGMVDALLAHPEVDPQRVILVGRSFGGVIAPRGASGEHRLAALIVDPGQYDMGAAVVGRLGPLAQRLDDPTADPVFQGMLDNPAMATLLGSPHGDQRNADRARVLQRHDPVPQPGHRPQDHLPHLCDGQRNRPRSPPGRARCCTTTCSAPRNSADSPWPRVPTATVKAWPPSCSGLRP